MTKRPNIFIQGFDRYVCMGDTITAEFEGFTFTATLYQDDDSKSPEERQDGFWPSLDPESAGYIGAKSQRTLERHMAHAKHVMAEWEAGNWGYCGVAVTVSRDDIDLTDQYAHAVWGCDYNYPCLSKRQEKTRHAYLVEYANDLAWEALEDAKAKLAKLAPEPDAKQRRTLDALYSARAFMLEAIHADSRWQADVKTQVEESIIENGGTLPEPEGE